MASASRPIINETWVVSMIILGSIGFFIHAILVFVTVRHYFLGSLDSMKGRLFIIACISLLLFNSVACLLWSLFRTDIMIPLTIRRCQAIYALNYICYFFGKYILHCLLIFRIYITFRRSSYSMSRRKMLIFIVIVTINFFLAMTIWVISIVPHVLVGKWSLNNPDSEIIIYGHEYNKICTLFSENANQNLWVKVSGISVGVEDLIVGSITFIVFVSRFRAIANEANDIYLIKSSFRFGVSSFFSVVSTLFLFTFAIPFYPDMTFVLAVDATINSLCLFCVLAVGENLYKYVCTPCWICGNGWIKLRKTNPSLSKTELLSKMFSWSFMIEQQLSNNSNSNIDLNIHKFKSDNFGNMDIGERPITPNNDVDDGDISNNNNNDNGNDKQNNTQLQTTPNRLNRSSVIFGDKLKSQNVKRAELSLHLVNHDSMTLKLPTLNPVAQSAPIPDILKQKLKLKTRIYEANEV